MASGVRAEPHVIARVADSGGALVFEAPGAAGEIPLESLALIQEGLRGVVRLPGGVDAYLALAAAPRAAGPIAEHRSSPMERGRSID
jgi:hypothetical protein